MLIYQIIKIKKKIGKLKLKNVLNELNELTDKLGITKESERVNYIYDKDKRIAYQNERNKEFKDKGEKNYNYLLQLQN